jgi:hypothetical protein
MNSKNKYSLKIDLSKIPSDIIPYISAHLTDCSVLDDSLRFNRANHYLLYFFFHKNMPKDAKQYNKLLTDKNKYYKDYDFTDHNKRNITGILKTIKTKYKQLKLRTYDITFDKTKYDLYGKNDECSWWKIFIYDNNEKNVLTLSKNGITTIEYKDNYSSHRFYQYTKEEQFIKNICSYIDNDIKYYMKQCFTYKRLELIPRF